MNRYYKKAVIISLLFSFNFIFGNNILFANETFSYNNDLIQAVNNNNVEATVNLIKNGASIDARGKFGITSLMRAAFNNNEKMLKLLLDLGADVEAVDIGGATALHIAARKGYDNIVDALIKQKIDIDIEDNDGWTPIMRAASIKSPRTLESLLRAKADPLKLNKWGQSAASQAILSNNILAVEILSKNKIFENLNEKEQGKLLNFAKLKNNEKIQSILEGNFNQDKKTNILEPENDGFLSKETNLSYEKEEKINISKPVILKARDDNSRFTTRVKNDDSENIGDTNLKNIAKEDLAIIKNGDFITSDEDSTKDKLNIIVTNHVETPALNLAKNTDEKAIVDIPWAQNEAVVATNNTTPKIASETVNMQEESLQTYKKKDNAIIISKKPVDTVPVPQAHIAKTVMSGNSPYWIETSYYEAREAQSKFDEITNFASSRNYRVKIVKPVNNSKISAIQVGPITNEMDAQEVCRALTNVSSSCKIVKNISQDRYRR